MKKFLIVLLGLFITIRVSEAQVVKARSKTFSFSKPPILGFDATFVDESEDNILDPGEMGAINLNIKNSGGRTARNVTAKLTPLAPLSGMALQNELRLGDIPAGGQKRVIFKLSTQKTTPSQKVSLRLEVLEALGYNAEAKTLNFSTRNLAKLQLIVTSPKNGTEIASPNVAIVGKIIHAAKIVDLRINGVSMGKPRGFKPVSHAAKTIGPDTTAFSYEVLLKEGVNLIRLEVMNAAGEGARTELSLRAISSTTTFVSFNPIISELRPIRQSQAYAVIIGVADYADPLIPDLKYTVNDARTIYDLLIDPRYGGFKSENVKLLLNQDATVQNIKSAIGSWLPKVTPEDATVVIFFAGHGAPEGDQTYWLTYEAKINDLYSTALNNDDIAAMLLRVKSDRMLTFLDCCYSAATINRTTGTRALVTEDPFKQFKGKGRVTITASDGKQQSIEDAAIQHGIFTYRLIEGLKGRADRDRDGIVFVEEAWDYVKNKVKADAQSRGHLQEPTLSGTIAIAIPLSRNYELALQNSREKQKEDFLALYRSRKIDGAMYQRIAEVIDASEDEKSGIPNLDDKRQAIRDFLDGKIKVPTFIELFGK